LFFVVCLFLWYWGLNSEPLHQPFHVKGFFEMGVSQTVCLGWI
jgi:hypothetical protein